MAVTMETDPALTNAPPQAASDNTLERLNDCLLALSRDAARDPGASIGASEKGEETGLAAWVSEFVQPLERQANDAVPLSEAQVHEFRTALMSMADTIGQLATSVRSGGNQNREGEPRPPNLDSATGLPGREDFKAAIAAKIKSPPECALALFVVDRLAYLNAKFGRPAGDQVLASTARHITETLPAGVPLFRWNGPAFAALLEIPHGLTAIERHVKKAATSRLEQTVEAGDRSVMLTVGRTYHLRRLGPSDSADTVCRALDDFIAARSLDATRAS